MKRSYKKHLHRNCFLRVTVTSALLTAASVAQAQNVWGNGPEFKPTPEQAARAAAEAERFRQEFALRKQAEEMIAKGNAAAAVPLLLQAVQAYEGSHARIYLADIYIQRNRPKDALEILRPIVYPPPNKSYSAGQDIATRMKYVLALLDTRQWPEAATLYEQSIALYNRDYGPLMWHMLGYGIGSGDKEHTLFIAHFSPEAEDVPGLRAQAHLILATNEPASGSLASLENKCLPCLLDHAQQSLKINPRSHETQFIEGRLLMEMNRYAEARRVFNRLMQSITREWKPEITALLGKMDAKEALLEAFRTHPAVHKEGYYEVTVLHPSGTAAPLSGGNKMDSGKANKPEVTISTFLWHPASPNDAPPQSVIVTEEGIFNRATGKTETRYRVIQSPGLRFSIRSDDPIADPSRR